MYTATPGKERGKKKKKEKERNKAKYKKIPLYNISLQPMKENAHPSISKGSLFVDVLPARKHKITLPPPLYMLSLASYFLRIVLSPHDRPIHLDF